MARIKGATMTRKRRKKVLKLAKGYFGAKSKLFKTAKEAVMKSGQYAYIGRRLKKRDFRKLWITRISAAAKMNGMNYSTFMNGLKKAGVQINRKMLAELAVNDATGFATLAKAAKKALDKRYGKKCWEYFMNNSERILNNEEISYKDFQYFKRQRFWRE